MDLEGGGVIKKHKGSKKVQGTTFKYFKPEKGDYDPDLLPFNENDCLTILEAAELHGVIIIKL